MTGRASQVLEAIARAERASRSPYLPLKRIALAVLDGDAALASRVLATLDRDGVIRTDVMGWQGGWLTTAGRLRARGAA